MTTKIAFIFRNSIIKQFKCDLGNEFLFLLCFVLVRTAVPYEQIREKEVCLFFFFFFRLSYIDFQLITHNKYLKGMQGVLVTGRITKLTISDRVCLKGRNSSIFHNFEVTCFPNQLMRFPLCVENFLLHIFFFHDTHLYACCCTCTKCVLSIYCS